MSAERRSRILTRLFSGEDPRQIETRRLCEVCAEVTCMTGAGLMLMSEDVPQGSVCTTNRVSALIEDLQYELGEGPCVDAHHQNQPVLEPDLAAPSTARWLGFTQPAVDAGVRAIFGFPLRVGAIRLGALNLYCDQPGELTDEQHADALVMADVAAQAILMLQANAAPGEVASELDAGAHFHGRVHQASGIVAVQLDISVGQALIRLRAHAFGNSRGLDDVARDVVDGSLRFDSREEKDSTP